VTFADTIAKSLKLERALARPLGTPTMPITDGEPLLSMKDLVADIRAAKNEFRTALQAELSGMAADIRANAAAAVGKVRQERKAVRDEFTELLGNEIIDTSQDRKS
jgi:uncharacterized protein (DUF3084 family)